jgi:stress response protein YsnF
MDANCAILLPSRTTGKEDSMTSLSSKTMQWRIALSALSLAAIGTGCFSSHPNYYASMSSESSGYSESSSASSSSSVSSENASEQQVAPSNTPETSDSGTTVIPLYEESIKVGKREVDAGTVRVRKIVTIETVNQPVQIRREQVVIERDGTDDQGHQTSSSPQQGLQSGDSSGKAFEQQETVIHLKKEEPVVQTQVVPAGRVVVQKRTETEQQNVQRQLRREDLQVENSGPANNVTVSDNLRQSQRSGDASGGGQSLEQQSRGSGSNTNQSNSSR